MRILLLFVLPLVGPVLGSKLDSWRGRPSIAEPKVQALVETTVKSLVKEAFPELGLALKEGRIEAVPFSARPLYLACRPKLLSGVWMGKAPKHVVYYDPSLFQEVAGHRSIHAHELRAVLAHELSHAVYFERSPVRGIFSGALAMALGGSKRIAFERRTDLDALSRGHARVQEEFFHGAVHASSFAPGLSSFRQWVGSRERSMDASGQLKPKVWSNRRRYYFFPEEIDLIDEGLKRCPALLEQWTRRPPHSAGELREQLESQGCAID